MGTFNTYGQKSRKYGGAYPVWLNVAQKERCGGRLDELPPAGTVIRAGTLVSIENSTGIAKLLPTFEVAVQCKTTDTELKLIANKHYPKPTVGMFITTESGKSTPVTSVTYDEPNNLYIIPINAGVFAANVSKGEILLRANQAGTEYYCIPTGLTENDVWVDEGDEYATVSSVFHGEIMEDRIQPIPPFLKDGKHLPMIKFVKGI